MIGIIPAAGAGQRIQPLGCSKELLPVGSRVVTDLEGRSAERPKAVSEYLVERMIAAGAEQIAMVVSPEKTDIVRYYAEREYAAEIFYVVQRQPRGLCDAIFRAEPFAAPHDRVLIGLPDTIWFPENGYRTALEAMSAAMARRTSLQVRAQAAGHKCASLTAQLARSFPVPSAASMLSARISAAACASAPSTATTIVGKM